MQDNHSFNVGEATKYGVYGAIMLFHFRFWLLKNVANNKHIYDNDVWTYNSVEAFTLLFPYFTYDVVKYQLKKLLDAGVIKTGNYNKKGYDRTKWYTIVGFYTMHQGNLPNGLGKNTQPIPDINSDINTDTTAKAKAVAKKATKKDSYNYVQTTQAVTNLLTLFSQHIDPKNKLYYNRRDMRQACDFLLTEYGNDRVTWVVKNMAAVLREITKSNAGFINGITTPCELRDKWQKVEQAVGAMKVKLEKKEADKKINNTIIL